MYAELRAEFTSVTVANQGRTRDFYRDKLGCKVIDESPIGPTASSVSPPGPVAAAVTLVARFDTMLAGSLLRLVIDSADIDESESKSRQRDATLRDSQGNRLVMSPMGQ
jgi:catechol 2,3-dioxygenase-like lactoylglutathione lyase family enzyme